VAERKLVGPTRSIVVIKFFLQTGTFCGAILLMPLLAQSAASKPTVWVVSGMERVGREDPPQEKHRIELFAARGEYEPFQIAVRATARRLTNVNLTLSDLRGPKGTVIGKDNLIAYREHYVHVAYGSPERKGTTQPPVGPGWYADGLVPFLDPATGKPPVNAKIRAAPFDVELGKNQPLWIDVSVPRNAVRGRYHGSFMVTSDQGRTTGEFELTVWNFELPLQPSLNSSFMLWKDKSAAACETILQHKLMPTPVSVQDAAGFVEKYQLSSINIGLSSGADYNHGTMSPVPSVEEIQKIARQLPSGPLLYNYTADEIVEFPNLYPEIKAWARNLHSAGILNLITMAPVPELFDDGSGSGRSAVDIWVLQPGYYEASAQNVAAVLRKGDRVWTYTALVQDDHSPQWEIDFPPIHYRVMQGFINQSLGFTGLLYWAVDYWTKNPWSDVDTYPTDADHYPGEGMLVYPGGDAGVQGTLPSLRLKWIRAGVEDYEYVELMKKAGKGDVALELARQLGQDFRHWNADPKLLFAVRRRMGEALDKH